MAMSNFDVDVYRLRNPDTHHEQSVFGPFIVVRAVAFGRQITQELVLERGFWRWRIVPEEVCI